MTGGEGFRVRMTGNEGVRVRMTGGEGLRVSAHRNDTLRTATITPPFCHCEAHSPLSLRGIAEAISS